MFRVIVTTGLTLIFALVSYLTYSTVGDHTRAEVEVQLHERLKGAHQSITHLQQLSHSATRARAEKIAQDKELKMIMALPVQDDESFLKRHQEVFSLVSRWKEKFKNKMNNGRAHLKMGHLADWNVIKPYFFDVVDQSGMLVADMNSPRRFAKNAEGTKFTRLLEKYPPIKSALENGKSFYDVWDVGHQLLVGVAPIRQGDDVLGAVILGYHINQNSEEYKRSLLADVGYFFQGKLQGSSTLGKEEETLEASAEKLISAYKTNSSTPIKVQLSQRTLLLRLGKVGGHESAKDIYFFVAVNESDALENAMGIRDILLAYLIIGLLVCLLVFWVSLHYFVNPIKDLEEGVIKVTNGDLKYWFTYEVGKTDISPTLSQHLDIMVSELTGRDMPEMTTEDDQN